MVARPHGSGGEYCPLTVPALATGVTTALLVSIIRIDLLAKERVVLGARVAGSLEPDGRGHMRHDRCVFNINGGWRERYRFLAQIKPTKIRKLAPTLFAQMQTENGL